MTLQGRIIRLESQTPAHAGAGARERLAAYLDAIAARQTVDVSTPKATTADLRAELAVILQRPKP